jgi:hypothetical protein
LTAVENRPLANPSPQALPRFVGEIPAELVTAATPGKSLKKQGKKVEQMVLF